MVQLCVHARDRCFGEPTPLQRPRWRRAHIEGVQLAAEWYGPRTTPSPAAARGGPCRVAGSRQAELDGGFEGRVREVAALDLRHEVIQDRLLVVHYTKGRSGLVL